MCRTPAPSDEYQYARVQVKGQFHQFLLVISSKVAANYLVAPTSLLEAINTLQWPPQCLHSVSVKEVLKHQYTSCMKVGTGGNLDLSREYHKKLFGPLAVLFMVELSFKLFSNDFNLYEFTTSREQGTTRCIDCLLCITSAPGLCFSIYEPVGTEHGQYFLRC